MKSVAYKWRISTTEYVYITSINYNKYDPNYFLGNISVTLTPEEDNIIIEHVKSMDRETYRKCFEHVLNITKDYDINLKNWEYYFNISREGCIDCDKTPLFYSGATATAEVSLDDKAYVDVNIENGILNFSFLIPKGLPGENGTPGEKGLDGVPGEDGSFYEYIYLLTRGDSYSDDKFKPEEWKNNDINYQYNNYVPSGWTDRPSGISEEYRCEWVSTRRRNAVGEWDLFSEPKLMSRWGVDGKDGDGIEYIYTRTENGIVPTIEIPNDWETNTKYQTLSEYINELTGWTDSPQGINYKYKYEWVSIRKQENGIWGIFSEAKLWSRWGEDGDGIEYIYCVTNISDKPNVPSINEEGYQNKDFYSGIWNDEYVEPTSTNRYAWVSSRKYSNGEWGAFSEPKMWNTYKVGGKATVELYTRTNTILTESETLPYNTNLYYSFESDTFYSNSGGTNVVTEVASNSYNLIWNTNVPGDVEKKYLYRIQANVILDDDITKLVYVPGTSWAGPFLVASNGENAVSNAPYIVFDDNSLSLPIKEKDSKPHEAYEYTFNAKLYYGEEQVSFTESEVTDNTNNDDSIRDVFCEVKNDNIDKNKLEVSFKINNDVVFNKIKLIYITLRGIYNNIEIEATSQFKIIPFKTEDATLYRILLNTYTIYIPDNENWEQEINGSIVNSRGDNVTLNESNKLILQLKNGDKITLNDNPITVWKYDTNTNNRYYNVDDFNKLTTVTFLSNGKVREVEYIHFINMPKDGNDGTSNRLVFAYRSTEEGETPPTPSGGSVNFNDNTITYPDGWFGNVVGTGVTWFSQSYFYSDVENVASWTDPIRLTGYKGDAGISPYHIELSNDMDQIFVTDGEVVITGQTITTNISLLYGGDEVNLNSSSVTIDNNSIFSLKNIEKAGKSVKVVLELTATTVTSSTNDVNININLDDYGNNSYDLTKKFKVVTINGTLDFDLNVSPTFIKVNDKDVKSSNEISVNVIKRDLSVVSKSVETVTYNEFTNYGLSAEYFFNENDENKISLTGETISLTNVDEFNKVTIILYKDETPIDITFVESVHDGKTFSIDLSNDYDQVYTVDNKVVVDQTIETIVYLRHGTEKVDISNATLTVNGESVTGVSEDNGLKLQFKFNSGGTLDDIDENKYDISLTYNGSTFNKTFKVVKLNGTIDYDLFVSTSVIKKDVNNYTPTEITVNVTKSDISTTNRNIEILSGNLPDNLSIIVNKDSSSDETYSTLPVTIEPSDVTNSVVIKLVDNNTGKAIDMANVEVVSDGVDGISPIHIELSNDMDQILTIDDVAISGQTIKTVVSLLKGTNIYTKLTTGNTSCSNKTEQWDIIPSESGDTIEYTFTPKKNVVLTDKEYVFDIKIDIDGLDYDLIKNFKITKLYGTKTYDLQTSHGIVKKEKNGYSPSAITINILETDITNTGQKITNLMNVPNSHHLFAYFNGNFKENAITSSGNGDFNLTIPSDQTGLTSIKVELIKSEGSSIDVIDCLNIEVVKDGIDGGDIEFIYKLYEDEIKFGDEGFNTGATKDELIASGWTVTPSGVSSAYTVEACSQRVKPAGSEDWGEWCSPFIWAKWGENGIDGDGVQYIFRVTDQNNTKPNNPSVDLQAIRNRLEEDNQKAIFDEIINRSDFTPTKEWVEQNIKNYTDDTVLNEISGMLWTDNPLDVGPYEPYEYVSIRRKTVNSNGTCDYTYTDPTLWNEWKKDGYNSFTEFIFAVDSRDLSKCTVTGGTWKDLSEKNSEELTFIQTLSGGTEIDDVYWFDSVPTHNNNINQYVWMVKGFANSEVTYTINDNITGITYSDIDWSTPVKLMDSQFMQVEYSCLDIEGKIPTPINLSDVVKSNENISLSDLERNFRNKDKEDGRTDWEWKNSNELSGETPVWMITSTLYNGTWTDWVVSRIKGEQGEKGDNGQSISIKGTFSNVDALKSAYTYYLLTDKTGYELPNEYFLNSALTLGDCYVLDTYNNTEGYLFTYIKENDDFNEAWLAIGKIRGESSFIYIAYASSVTIDDKNIKTYHLTEGGVFNSDKYYGTTPGKYIGIHVATQQYEGHPYPPILYYSPTVEDVNTNGPEKLFIWSKWEGEDGFGQEQIFILSGDTAPNVPTSEYTKNSSGETYTPEEWNAPDFVPYGWSDVPLTPTLTETDNRCCWMVTRQYPFNGTGYNEFKGDNEKAILFSRYSKDGLDGSSPYHIELSNDMEQVYTVNDIVQVQQTASTILTLFHGSSPIDIEEINVSNSFITGETISGGSIEIYRIFNISEAITDKEVTCDITVKTNSGDTLQHKFKVIKLNGNKDYDIQVNTPYIVYDAIGRDIEISVTETNVDINNREIKKISLGEYETLGLSIKGYGYKKPDITNPDATKIDLTLTASTEDNCYKFKTSGNDFLYFDFDLMKSSVKIDTTKVEVIRNGTSSYNIDLSNDMEQVYTVNDVVQVQQTATTVFSIFEGNTKLKNSNIEFSGITASVNGDNVTNEIFIYNGNVGDVKDKTIFINSGDTTGDTFTLSKVFKTGETLQGYSHDIELSIPMKNRPTLTKTFKIIKLNGTVDYDLSINPSYIVNPSGLQTFNIVVTESNIDINNRSIKLIDRVKFPNIGLELDEYGIDLSGNELRDFIDFSTEPHHSATFTGKADFTNLSKLIINLKSGGTTIDSATLEVLRDGKDGSSPYHVELSNDFDMISVQNGNVVGEQSTKTSVYLYEGNEKRNITKIEALPNNSNLEGRFTTGLTTDSGATVEFDFNGFTGFTSTITPIIKVNDKYETFMTIKPTESLVSYYLIITPGFVVRSENTNIKIRVFQKVGNEISEIYNDIGDYNLTVNVRYDTGGTVANITKLNSGYTVNSEDILNVKNIIFTLIDENSKINDVVNVEVKDEYNASGILELTPNDIIVYLDKNNKPLVDNVILNSKFIYDGELININSVFENGKLTISSSNNDFDDNISLNGSQITLTYKSNVEFSVGTKEECIVKFTYNGRDYENNFYVTYINGDLTISGVDTLYIPKVDKSYSCKFDADVYLNDRYVLNECDIKVRDNSGVTFNKRKGVWYINFPSDFNSTSITVYFTYDNITSSKDYNIQKSDSSLFWYINAYPQTITNSDQIVEVYITRGEDDEYISYDNFNENNLSLYYKLDGDETETKFVNDNKNILHGNLAFYAKGYKTRETSQEPIYSKIEFILKENDKIVASEFVERYDIINNYEFKTIPYGGLQINPTEIYSGYTKEGYDIVLIKI